MPETSPSTGTCPAGNRALKTRRGLGFLACALASTLWGTGFYFGKIALRELQVGHMVLYRFVFAAAAMLAIRLRQKDRTPYSREDWTSLLLAAFFGIPVLFLLEFKGLAMTTLAHAALMVGTMPVLVAGAAAIFLHERLDRTGWFALAGSTAGAAMIALSHSQSTEGSASIVGDLLVIGAAVFALVWILASKRLLLHHNPVAVSCDTVLSGTAMLALWVLLRDGPPPVHGISPAVWCASAAGGLLCTASTTLLWNWSLTQIPASEAGVFLNLEPIIGSALSVWLFHERMGWTAALGGGLIVASAVVMTTQSKTSVRETAGQVPAME